MGSPRENLAARLLGTALDRGWGERVALRERDRAWTYAQLADQTARVSTALRTLRIGRGERVAVFMRDSLETAAAILGAIHAGAIAVPISELARPLNVRDYLNDSGAVAAIVHASLEPTLDEIRAEVPNLREVLCTKGEGKRTPGERDFHSAVRASAPSPEAMAVSTNDVAFILYSAGSVKRGPSGERRGVPHVHGTPIAAFESFARGIIGLGEGDRVFSVVRLSTAYGLGAGLLFPLAAGAEAALVSEQPRSEVLFAVLETLDPTVLVATPSVYGQLARDAEVAGLKQPLRRLRACAAGAEGMPPKLIPKIRKVLGAEVTVGYNLTEAFQFVLAGVAGSGRPGACGKPVPGFEARIVDDDGRVVGPDEIGTLQIRGKTVLSSYWGEADNDDGQFSAGWFTTRDRFMRDAGDDYFHFGRVDDQFKVGGKWVSPAEVEGALLANEAVWECAVIGADDEDGLTKPLAFVVPNIGREGNSALALELRAYVKEELAPYKYPRWIEFVDQIPKGPNGKILRYKLHPPRKLLRAETASD